MPNIKIELDYYNKEEKQKFKENYPEQFDLIEANIGTMEVPLEDFKSYFLFRRQTEDNPEVFRDFEQQAHKLWPWFDQYFKYDPDSKLFTSTVASVEGMREVSESLGVAGALCISSKLFLGKTQADWRKIPEQKHKDFDFKHRAVHDSRYLVVESKGSITEDHGNASAVSEQKRNILNKKGDDGFASKYNTQNSISYGIITVAGMKEGLKSWLVDPPGDEIFLLPEKYRLLSRLYFYNDYLRLISQRSYPSILLPNRIKDIAAISDYGSLDKRPLLGSGFNKVVLRESFINSRSSLVFEGQEVIGHISTNNDNGEFLFIGLQTDVIRDLLNQDFDRILKYSKSPNTINLNVNAKVTASYENRQLSKILEQKKYFKDKNKYSFRSKVKIHRNSAGVYFGLGNSNDILNNG